MLTISTRMHGHAAIVAAKRFARGGEAGQALTLVAPSQDGFTGDAGMIIEKNAISAATFSSLQDVVSSPMSSVICLMRRSISTGLG